MLRARTLLAALSVVPAALPQSEGFPAFVWRGPNAGTGEAEAALLAPFGGAVVIGADEAEWVRAAGLEFFVFNAQGRDALHLDRSNEAYQKRWRAWYGSRDDEHLVREPCLTDEQTVHELVVRLGASLSARGGAHGHGVSLGDEVSLTPGGSPGDECLSESCRSLWAHEREDDPASYSTDAVRLELTDGGTTLLGGWLARRRFHQDVVLELLEEAAHATRGRAPGTPVGLLGLGGRTAFGNVAVERALPWLDFIECYPVSDARELMFTLRTPEQRTWATIFPDPAHPHAAAREAWEHWMRGGDGVVVWQESTLAAEPELAARTAAALATIRELRAQLPEFRPRPRGVALVHSPDSIAMSWLRDALLDGPTWPKRLQGYHEEHGTRERALDAWLRTLEDEGTMPGALPIDEIGARTLERFPVLIASQVLVLSDAQVAGLREFVQAGGTLVAEEASQLGAYDEAGNRRETGTVFVHLCIEGERVYDAPRIPSRGLTPSVFEELPLERAPWRITGHEPALPWLSTWCTDGAGGFVCATLPNPAEGALVPREVTIEPRSGFAVRWVHPASDEATVELAAGDAAVFRLVRAGD
jgi:hypothetical protein